jgi:hypothetical protein
MGMQVKPYACDCKTQEINAVYSHFAHPMAG